MGDGSEKESPPVLKRIFEYSNYRDYLRDYYDFYKATKRAFSFRLFSRQCGFKSSNFLMLVMNGKSSLTSVSVEKVITGLKFNKEEGDFFRHLVAFNEAKTTDGRTHHAQAMMRSRTFKKIFQMSEAQYRYLGTWFLPVIRSVVGLKNYKSDPHWIAESMCPKLTSEQVSKALEEMLALGLLKKDEAGKLSQSERMIATPPEIASTFAAQYHRQMLELAGESIDRFKREERHLAGMTVALDKESVARVKEMAEKFRNDVMAVASESVSAESIYQVNFQFFPLFQGSGEKK